VKAALAGAFARKLRESTLAALEDRLYRLKVRPRGFRSDRTSVDRNGVPRIDTLGLIALEVQQPRNAVADRRKVFFSRLSPDLLKEAVDGKRISRSAAAALVRAAEHGLSRGAPPHDATPDVAHARRMLEVTTRARLLDRSKHTTRKRQPKATSRVVVLAADGHGCMRGEITLFGRTWSISVEGRVLTLGRARALPMHVDAAEVEDAGDASDEDSEDGDELADVDTA
jgi:hypothetical protein